MKEKGKQLQTKQNLTPPEKLHPLNFRPRQKTKEKEEKERKQEQKKEKKVPPQEQSEDVDDVEVVSEEEDEPKLSQNTESKDKSQSEDEKMGMEIDETGKEAPTVSDKEEGEEERKKGEVTPPEKSPQENTPREQIKNPSSPLPQSYTVEYNDPKTGQTVRKLVMTQKETHPFQPKHHLTSHPQETHASSSSGDQPTPMMVDTAVKRRRSEEEVMKIKKDGQGSNITRTETDAERSSRIADHLLAQREADRANKEGITRKKLADAWPETAEAYKKKSPQEIPPQEKTTNKSQEQKYWNSKHSLKCPSIALKETKIRSPGVQPSTSR